MNSVNLIGRITKDIEVRYTSGNDPLAVVRFSVAIDRGKDKNGNDRGADFPNIIAFGRTAENIGKYFAKGDKIGITGHIQTGSYEKDGRKVYTTDIVCDRFDFCNGQSNAKPAPAAQQEYPGYETIDDADVPF